MHLQPIVTLLVAIMLAAPAGAKTNANPPITNAKALTHPHSSANYTRHVRALRPKLRKLKGRFRIAVQRPFVVITDGYDLGRQLRFVAKVVALLKKDFFQKDPRIIDVYLFRNTRSYQLNARRLTGETPDTPYGFYLPRLNALIMNIGLGAGTLSHEIVHPFMETNFPQCPPWFNEGLGSLYEAVWWRKGKIWGFVNWRLPGLQRAIRARRLPSFSTLMAQNENRFYNEDPGTNYAQARYLLFYLQNRGLLRRYYRLFRANVKKDPTGLSTLKQLLGVQDMARFQRSWEKAMLKLRWKR